MKGKFLLLLGMAAMSASCFTTRVVTVDRAATSYNATSYLSNQIYGGNGNVTVNAQSYDISMHLDLSAVAAAFAQSGTVLEFEHRINNSNDFISNLDLNNDGYVDYIRVMETIEGNDHIFLLQASLGSNIYQDVATIVVEDPNNHNYCVEIIGSPFLYGPNYYIRPLYVMRPLIFDHICSMYYRPYKSAYYWNHYPARYIPTRPLIYDTYHFSVRRYMERHRYCRDVIYPVECHYANHVTVVKTIQRNDYGKQHPDHSYTQRMAKNPTGVSALQRAEEARRQEAKRQEQYIKDYQSRPATRPNNGAVTRPNGTVTRPAGNAGTRPAGNAGARPAGTTARPAANTSRPAANTSRPAANTSRPTGNNQGTSTVREVGGTTGSTGTVSSSQSSSSSNSSSSSSTSRRSARQ